MNYELCKQLKDAGFPQKDRPFCVSTEMEIDEKGEQVRCYMPSLSELIEACGKEFDYLRDWSEYWLAVSGGGLEGQGSTPEEAVTKLWLALNKK